MDIWINELKGKSRSSSAVEHFLGKEEVVGSSPIFGSQVNNFVVLLTIGRKNKVFCIEIVSKQ